MQTRYDKEISEDKRFQEATPSGSIEFQVKNPTLDGFFVPGKCYYIDICLADD